MPLDFIVFGVPRSGTTAVSHGLNLHPKILCGNEYFPTLESARTSPIPDAFADDSFAHTPNCESTRRLFLTKRGSARIFGNKDPRYFYYLDRFHARTPGCKKICIYRPRLEFWSSWDQRASNADDIHWNRGQTGFFGVLELICLLGHVRDVAASGEVLLVNYDSLFFDDASTIQIVFDYLGAERNDAALSDFRQRLFAPAGLSKSRANEDATAAYALLQLREFERLVFARPAVTNIELADALSDYCQDSRACVSEFIDLHFSRMSLRQLSYFIQAGHLRKELADMGIQSCALRTLDAHAELSTVVGSGLVQLSQHFDNLRQAADHSSQPN